MKNAHNRNFENVEESSLGREEIDIQESPGSSVPRRRSRMQYRSSPESHYQSFHEDDEDDPDTAKNPDSLGKRSQFSKRHQLRSHKDETGSDVDDDRASDSPGPQTDHSPPESSSDASSIDLENPSSSDPLSLRCPRRRNKARIHYMESESDSDNEEHAGEAGYYLRDNRRKIPRTHRFL